MRRIGVLMHLVADDAEGQTRVAAFLQQLQQLGWTDGRNVRIDYCWVATLQQMARTLRSCEPNIRKVNSIFGATQA